MWSMVFGEGRSVLLTRDEVARIMGDAQSAYLSKIVRERYVVDFGEFALIAPLGSTREDLQEIGISA